MNSQNPFPSGDSCCGTNYDMMVDQLLGNAYPVVKFVAMRMPIIKTLSDNIDDLIALAGSLEGLNDLAAKLPELMSLQAELQKLIVLYDNLSKLVLVADNMTQILTVHDNLTQIQAVVSNITAITAVGSNITAVNGVYANMTAILNVEANAKAIGNVSTYMTDVRAVSANVGAVTSVAASIPKILAVNDNIADVRAVGQDIAKVVNVADNMAAVTVVTNNMTKINVVANNVVDVTNFADVYYGPSSINPSVRKDGTPLQTGDLYFNTRANEMRVFTSSGVWKATGAMIDGVLSRPPGNTPIIATAGQTVVPVPGGYNTGFILVLVNGVAVASPNVDTTSGVNLTFASPLAAGDKVDYFAFGLFNVANATPAPGSVSDDKVFAGSKLANRINDFNSDKDFASLGAALTATAGLELRLSPGVHTVTSNVTIDSTLVIPKGAILKPASGVIITFNAGVEAGPYQIFDYSAGGIVQFSGQGIPEVFAEWWGAKSDGIKTDNQIPIQQACDSVQTFYTAAPFTTALNGDNQGGVVRLGFSGIYLVSGVVKVTNRCVIRGLGVTSVIQANPATWSGTTMFHFQMGTNPQFFCRLESLALNAGNINAITQVVYAPAWQESCGMRDVLVINFRNLGLLLDNGYGGSVGCVLRDVQFMAADAAPDPYCIYADFSTYVVGWYNLVIEGASLFCGSSTVSAGRCISAKGRIRIDFRHLHVGSCNRGVHLETNATLVGTTLGADNFTKQLIVYNTDWTGYIDVSAVRKGFSTHILIRSDENWTIHKDFEPIFGRLRYPHSSGETVAFSSVTNGLTTPTQSARGFSAITKVSTGLYRLTFDPAMWSASAGSAYGVRVSPSGVAGLVDFVQTKAPSFVEIQFKDTTGAIADCSDFTVEIYGSPTA